MNDKQHGIEVNGPANIVMMVNSMPDGATKEQLQQLKEMAERTIRYMRAWEQDNSVRWSDIK